MLKMIDTHREIAEIGCGSGYLAKHMKILGADIVCCDNMEEQPLFVKGFFSWYYFIYAIQHQVSEFMYTQCDGRDFVKNNDGFPDRALLICWGHFSEQSNLQLSQCIDYFKGPYLYIIGERKNGCTFRIDDYMTRTSKWVELSCDELPVLQGCFDSIQDCLTIYQRT